jgi:hypothetical protein
MKSASEYLQQAAKYDALAAQTTNNKRRAGYARFAEVYRYFAEESALLNVATEEEQKSGSAKKKTA